MTLPPVSPDVAAAAVEGLTSRLLKKLDAAIEQYAAAAVTVDGEVISVNCGADAVVTLLPGPGGAVVAAEQARCSCLLAPKCLHRAAVLGACPVAEAEAGMQADGKAGADSATAAMMNTEEALQPPAAESAPEAATAPTEAQVAAAAQMWSAAAAVLAAGIPGAGAVPQAELLRAAHTARLAGLHRIEAAALRVVRGLRGARSRSDGHRLADLVAALRDLLTASALLSTAHSGPDLVGTARRAYEAGGSLRVQGVCREPVISATGYAGVVTHVLAEDGRWLTVSDVKPGGASRARGAATATVALGAAVLDHAQLSRGGLLIAGATVSADGRLGAGRGVRATPLPGQDWSTGPSAALFARPLSAAAAARLAADLGEPSENERQGEELVGCEVVVVGAAGDRLLVRDAADPAGPLIRFVAAHGHPDLAHTANLRQLASRPGLRLRAVGRVDPDHPATLRPLAVGPVPGTEATLRLPDAWQGHADLGYDRLQGAHLPPPEACDPVTVPDREPADLLAESPLWRLANLVELAVSGGRRTVAESAPTALKSFAPLRNAGFTAAADRATALTAESARRPRDVFGRLTDPDPHRYAQAWLAAAVHLAATERALVRASWGG